MDTWEKNRQDRKDLLRDFSESGAGNFWDNFERFNELIMRYHSAIREVRTKFEVLNDDLSLKKSRNPIESISSRVKKPVSIARKLRKLGAELTVENIQSLLNDVAGIRVICSFIDDIYSVADMLAKQADVRVICVKDYIRNPKPNGYRSYHMIVEIPVFFSDCTENMRVEIQIRTVAMDFWASLEHEMRYKNENESSKQIADELKACAETIAATDLKMLELRRRIERQAGTDCPVNAES